MHTKGNAETYSKSRLQYSSLADQKHFQFQNHFQTQDCKIFFSSWAKRNGAEPRLPGFAAYTPEQVMFNEVLVF